MMSRRRATDFDLGGAWSFAFGDAEIDVGDGTVEALRRAGLRVYAATVPGNLELDLLANGLIEEPFQGMNIVSLRRFERSFVYYTRTFEAPPAQDGSPVVVFEGVDCDASIYLNKHLVYRSDNMLVEHHVQVAGVLKPGATNTLCVALRPVMQGARSPDHAYPPGLTAEGSGFEGLYVRKAPHMYGWDIMPRALSAGLWRAVTLRFLPAERIDWAWLETEALTQGHAEARLALHFRAVTDADPRSTYEVLVEGSCGDSMFGTRVPLLFDAGCLKLSVTSPHLWWPRGRGTANSVRRDG